MPPEPDRWSSLDWTLPNAVLAEQLGVSRQAVHRRRCSPSSNRVAPKPRHLPAIAAAQLALLRATPGVEMWPYTQVAELLTLGPGRQRPEPIKVHRLLVAAGLRALSVELPPPDQVDWRLPNSAVAIAWRSRMETVTSVRRLQRQPRAVWPARGWHLDPEAMAAFDEQERRARALAG